jgi:hypothetical protein
MVSNRKVLAGRWPAKGRAPRGLGFHLHEFTDVTERISEARQEDPTFGLR